MAVITSLISYYPLDEASGDALDAHGANNLTETSGTIDSATGKVGNARDFELGDTEWFTKADNTDHSVSDIDFCLQAWIKPETVPSLNMGVVTKDNISGNREYGLYVGSDNKARFYVCASGTTVVAVLANNAGVLSAGTWYHLVGWHDSVNNQIGIAVNDGTPDTASHTTGVQNGTGPFQIGAFNGTLQFDGLIDEVGFWKRMLTSGERTWLYNSGNGRSYADIVAEATSIKTWNGLADASVKVYNGLARASIKTKGGLA